MKIAAIDIGSNAARLQISKVLDNEGVLTFKKVEYVRFPLRLGMDVFNTGSISAEGEVRLYKMLHSFKLLMELHECKDYMICATSAMREASNSLDIVTRIEGQLDMKIQIIDGTKEAELINNVVVQSLASDKNYLHVDVGGGSSELNLYVNRAKVTSRSFKIGSVRLLEGKEQKSDWDKMKRWILDNIDPNQSELIAIGTGGNINKLFNLSETRLSPVSMDIKELERIKTHIASYTLEDRINKLQLNPDRADVIVPASEIYLSAMRWSGAKEIMVPDLGLKDGIIQYVYDRYLHRKRKKETDL
ncbi:Ppx/GppA phosphatase family protein [Siphonobacter sp. SORGH_AS_0500]|uniref:Ppx/GppA phosphatase family protein n=1 Tax=Siphonobacter sp. SORGH_AS_0500 TaxID=1864824 RepID=UPI000CAB2806|nr:phosphatase [Siphonobacter sp. SORGH_AS_0500]MDR6195591.1 exopolyphosphatase/guanosine-5'-triphosphate,3'-diphosphate pyrophosphatase [Siphonobacter sp. SORGH_AS_0500]PKK35305.1 phosphatase [Siphonobacter sp. SORGH_AS_0500]